MGGLRALTGRLGAGGGSSTWLLAALAQTVAGGCEPGSVELPRLLRGAQTAAGVDGKP